MKPLLYFDGALMPVQRADNVCFYTQKTAQKRIFSFPIILVIKSTETSGHPT